MDISESMVRLRLGGHRTWQHNHRISIVVHYTNLVMLMNESV